MPKLGRRTPCPECPWLKRSAPGYLGADKPEPFFRSSVVNEGGMPCHMSIDYDDPDWVNTQLADADLCAGNLIFLNNWMKRPRLPEMAAAVDAVGTSPHVFATPEEFFEHHAPRADPGIVQRALWPHGEAVERLNRSIAAANEGRVKALRAAAKLMRERAEGAEGGPWCWAEEGDPAIPWVKSTRGPVVAGYRFNIEHIAGMDPLVAVAVADLLDKIAWMGELDEEMLGRVGCDEAIAIARVYLTGRTDR